MLDKTKIENSTINDQPTADYDPVVKAMALRHAHIEVNCEPPSYEITETNVADLLADLESSNEIRARRVLAQYAFKLPLYEKLEEGFEHSLDTVKSDLVEIKKRYALARRQRAFSVVTRFAGILSPRPRTS